MYNYGFDDFNNLSYREDDTENLKEEFSYDDLNRLVTSDYYENSSFVTTNLEMEYDDEGYGNILSKSDVGEKINYGENAGPNALTSVYNIAQDYDPAPQHITYTPFNKLETIIDTLDTGDSLTLDIDYGLDNQRRKSVLTHPSAGNKTKYYFGDYEIISNDNVSKEYIFINSPVGSCAVVEFYDDSGIRKKKVWHAYTDHLGSLVYLENADNSSETLNYSYDAWGNPRKYTDWLDDDPVDDLIADRGITGHEHLTEFGLINMNGRVYDPKLGRFLSPDPVVQAPHLVGGFNWYAYCLNNPGAFLLQVNLLTLQHHEPEL